MSTVAASAASSDPAVAADDDRELRRLEDARFGALVKGDWDAFAELCDPQLRYTHTTALTDSLHSYVARGRSGHYDYRWIESPIDRIVIYDDIALLFGQMRSEMVAGGKPRELDNLTLSIWRKTDGQWRLLAYQPTARIRTPSPLQKGHPVHE